MPATDDTCGIHPTALIDPTATIGRDTRVGAFVRIAAGAIVRERCEIAEHVSIDRDVSIGDRVTLRPGAHLEGKVTVESDVYIGPNVTLGCSSPPSVPDQDSPARTHVQQGARVEANAMVLDGITVGRRAVVSAGSVVTKNVPPHAVVMGNPAQIRTYVDLHSPVAEVLERGGHKPDIAAESSRVAGVKVVRLPLIADLRGNLSVAEFERDLPFVPKRYFVTFAVPNEEVRGEHAHRGLHEFLVCVSGSCSVVVDDGETREEFVLDAPNLGLYLPPMVWRTQYKHTHDAVLLVLASDVYDAADYIRDYDEYLALVHGQPS